MHSLIKQSAMSPKVKNNVDDICWSLLSYFCIMYLIYYELVIYITRFFFDTPSEEGVQELYFGYLAITEFAALIFMRTRPFIRYFPVAYSLTLFLFLLYVKFSIYGFKLYAMLTVHSFGICLFSWFMLKL